MTALRFAVVLARLAMAMSDEASCTSLLRVQCDISVDNNTVRAFCRGCSKARGEPICADAPKAIETFKHDSCKHILCQDGWLSYCGIQMDNPGVYSGLDCNKACGAWLSSESCQDHPAIERMRENFGPQTFRCSCEKHADAYCNADATDKIASQAPCCSIGTNPTCQEDAATSFSTPQKYNEFISLLALCRKTPVLTGAFSPAPTDVLSTFTMAPFTRPTTSSPTLQRTWLPAPAVSSPSPAVLPIVPPIVPLSGSVPPAINALPGSAADPLSSPLAPLQGKSSTASTLQPLCWIGGVLGVLTVASRR